MQDNLNTHRPVSLVEAFDPAEARRIAERLKWHSKPKHGSWLYIAECELSTLGTHLRLHLVLQDAGLLGDGFAKGVEEVDDGEMLRKRDLRP